MNAITITGYQAEHTGSCGPKIIEYVTLTDSCSCAVPLEGDESRAGHFTKIIIPKTGFYAIHVSYVRDSQQNPGDCHKGTNDDTNIRVIKNDAAEKPILAAFAPESSAARMPGVTAGTFRLEKDDVIHTVDWAAKDRFRRFRNCSFSLFLIGV